MLIASVTIAGLMALGLALYWRRLSPAERSHLGEAMAENLHTMLILLAVLALPAALLLPLPEGFPGWVIIVAGLGAWGVLVAGYWDRLAATANPVAPSVFAFLPGMASTTSLLVTADGDVQKTFRWVMTAREGLPVEMRVDLTLSTKRYQSARAEPRRPNGQWAHYVAHDMPELEALAAEFQRLHAGRGWSSLEQASNVLCFTQACIRYALDAESAPAAEWPRYPIETLMDEAGDCEDKAILAAAVLKRLGFEVALLYYPDHCAFGVAGAEGLPGEYVADPNTRLKYFYGEATADGWRLGEAPEKYRGRAPGSLEVVKRVIMDVSA